VSEPLRTPQDNSETTARRDFLRRAGKATATAPAIALLLAASTRPAAAQYRPEQDSQYRGRQGRNRPPGR